MVFFILLITLAIALSACTKRTDIGTHRFTT